ncbi:MAG: ABC-F family ATP-binding cassette domain-containing protein [Myxococcaceae bacterium]
MPNIQVMGVSKRYGNKKLFEDVAVNFAGGRRYGLTGPNGAGKSTFMKILAGEIEPDAGSVSRPKKTSVLRQHHFGNDTERVLDVVIQGNRELWAVLAEKERLLSLPELSDEQGNRLGELEGMVAEENGYTAESDAADLLEGLGVPTPLHQKALGAIPSGAKVRVLLAQALFGQPEALLLDEPTNDLDLDSIRWLEHFLCRYPGVLVTISHDRHFLNEICTHIADIDYETIIQYPGGYDDMIMAKSQVRSRIESENAEKQKKISQLQDFVARFSAGTRASQVQSRKKALEKLQLSDLKRSNIERPFIKFEQKRPSGKQTLTFEGVSKAWPGCIVCDKFDALITRGEKVALIGPNGVGKTTLCRILAGDVQPDSGEVIWGHEAKVGYLAQNHREAIPNGTTVAQYLHGFDPKAGNEEVRGLLGRMLFRGEEGLKPTEALSGGEAVRLIFSRLMLTKENVLVLDEPTNHLDLESIVALSDALTRYEGTAFVASHDRDLVSGFATRIFAFTPKGLIDFKGTYDEFVSKYGEDATRPEK